MRLQFRRSPPFGRLDLRFVSSFVLQHPVMADDDVDAFSAPRRLLRDLRRQDVDTTMMCPGVTREDVSILHAIVRSRTTSIDEVDVIGPRSSSLFTSRDSSFFFSRRKSAARIADVNEDRQFGLFYAGRSTSSSRRDDDSSARSIFFPPTPPPPPLFHLLSSTSTTSAFLAGVLLLLANTTTRVDHFVLGGGVRRGHDPRRPEDRSLTFFRWRSPSSEGE